MIPYYIQHRIVIVPLPDLVQCAKCFSDRDLDEQVVALTTLTGRLPDDRYEAQFILRYLVTLNREAIKRGLTKTKLDVDALRLATSCPPPVWYDDAMVFRDHRAFLMNDDPDRYANCYVRDETGNLITWEEESIMKNY